jgi:cysteine desulfurase/selenocysteine lyase
MTIFPVEKIRADFPILKEKIRNKPLVYLDNAASCQKLQQVIDSIVHCYSHEYANVHRGVHTLSVRATDRYEGAREKVKDFINAQSTKEIIFVRGATEAINLIAQTFGKANIKAGDEILITAMEHHSNIVPWQMLCEGTGAVLKVAPIDLQGELIFSEFEKLITDKTKLVSVVHMSNALGTINPVKKIIAAAKAKNIPVLLDGAQAIPHLLQIYKARYCIQFRQKSLYESYLLPPDKEASLLIKLAYHKAHQYLKGHIIYVQKTHKNHNPKPVHRQTYVESRLSK